MSIDIASGASARTVTRDALDRLARFEPGDAPVLTVYLDLSPDRRERRAWAIVLEDLEHERREGLDEEGRAVLAAEIQRVQHWLDKEVPGGRGVVVFTCSSRDLWEAYSLPAVERDVLAFQPTPYLGPLLDIVEEYERYAVALVDKERARLFSVFMAGIEEAEAFEDEVPGKHDQGGPSQMKFQRDHEKHVLWHLKRVVDHLSKLLERRAFDRLVVAGPPEATSELRKLLTHDLASRLVEVVPFDASASPASVLEATLDIERRVERESEERLVTDLFDAMGPRGHGSCGLTPTLAALQLGAIRTLVIADGLRVAGSECPNCGSLLEGATATCPIDGTELRANEDVVDAAARRTLDTKGEVEVVHDAAADRLTERCGGIGAVLRFRAG